MGSWQGAARPRSSGAQELLREERGSVVLIVAFGLLALLAATALVVDLGRAYVAWSRLRAAVQTAALSGAEHLPGDSAGAIQAACQALVADGLGCPPGNVSIGVNAQGIPNAVHVTAAESVPTYLARAFGVPALTVGAKATAVVGPVDQVRGAVPLGVPESECPCVPGETYVLKVGAGGGELAAGNFGALALGGNGASVYAQNLASGYSGELAVGMMVPTETGDLSGPTCSALATRLEEDPEDSWQTAEATSPRVLLVPIVALPEGGIAGKGVVEIVGFGAFFLGSGCSGPPGQESVEGTFLRRIVVAHTDAQGADFGLDAVRLVYQGP